MENRIAQRKGELAAAFHELEQVMMCEHIYVCVDVCYVSRYLIDDSQDEIDTDLIIYINMNFYVCTYIYHTHI